MSKEEFYAEYLRLHQKWPHLYMKDNPSKLRALFEICEPLPVSWLRGFINRVVKTEDVKLDIIKAAMGEIKAKRNVASTLDMIMKEPQRSDDALEKILSSMGVSSLVEAIEKRK